MEGDRPESSSLFVSIPPPGGGRFVMTSRDYSSLNFSTLGTGVLMAQLPPPGGMMQHRHRHRHRRIGGSAKNREEVEGNGQQATSHTKRVFPESTRKVRSLFGSRTPDIYSNSASCLVFMPSYAAVINDIKMGSAFGIIIGNPRPPVGSESNWARRFVEE